MLIEMVRIDSRLSVSMVCPVCNKRYFAALIRLRAGRNWTCSVKCGVKRNHQLGIVSFKGSRNPRWKGGISQNHYHYKKLQVARYPERVRARNAVHVAVKAGRLKKTPCVSCGSMDVYAHHDDYSKPLDVVWYCRKHHREIHGNKH